MSKRDKSLLDLENKIGKNNEKEKVLKNMLINKPNMKMDLLNNNKFNKGNLLSFLDKFKKENEKILNDDNKLKYNIENNPQEEGEESDEENNINNKVINLDENEENKKEKRTNNKKGTKIEMDLLMGILEQQKKKEISIDDIIEYKKNENLLNDDNDIINKDNKEKGEKEIINFLINEK